MSGSFHLSIFVFCQFWQQSYNNQLSFSGKDSTADFFVFGHFDQNTKNQNCNEPDICEVPLVVRWSIKVYTLSGMASGNFIMLNNVSLVVEF